MKLTALEWFEYLPKKQRDLAQAYFCEETSDKRDFNRKYSSLSSAIVSGFFWSSTKEGNDYWYEIYANKIQVL